MEIIGTDIESVKKLFREKDIKLKRGAETREEIEEELKA